MSGDFKEQSFEVSDYSWEATQNLLQEYKPLVPETKVPQLSRRQKLGAVVAYRLEMAARMESMEETEHVLYYKRKF